MSEKFSLQKALADLEKLEVAMQTSDLDLDKAIASHKEALQLAKQITEYLDTVETELVELEKSEK